jgi:ADP-heptose:LPS heptosyltransferase
MRLLLLQLKRIGDAILTAPTLGALRQTYPEAEMTLMLSGPAAGLGRAFGMVDQVLTYAPGALARQCWKAAAFGKYDAVLDFTGTDRSSLLTLLSRARQRFGYAKDAKKWLRRRAYRALCDASVRDLHTVDFHHALAQLATQTLLQKPLSTVPDAGHLTLPPDLAPPALPGSYVVVHPGTARAEKYWPAARWVEVIQHLQNQHQLPVILTGATDPMEVAHLREIEAGCKVQENFAGQLSLLQLTSVIAHAKLVLGVDSAAMHLAAATQRPQIALFGPTNPYHWRSRHAQAVTLLAGPEAVPELLPKHAKHAMNALPTQRVTAAVDSLLSS